MQGVVRNSDWGAWCERSELHLGVWGQASSENFKIIVYNDRLYSMRDSFAGNILPRYDDVHSKIGFRYS